MTTICAGTRVTSGYYFSTSTWVLHNVPEDGRMLPGTAEERYVAVPLLLAFVVAPLLGAAFLMFLPFAGFVLTAQAALAPVSRLFGVSASEVAATLVPGWQPGEAHLAGRRSDGGSARGRDVVVEDRLARLEREIAARRAAR